MPALIDNYAFNHAISHLMVNVLPSEFAQYHDQYVEETGLFLSFYLNSARKIAGIIDPTAFEFALNTYIDVTGGIDEGYKPTIEYYMTEFLQAYLSCHTKNKWRKV